MEFLNNQIFETIELEAYNDWLHVKLNSPKSKNALSNAMITELINLISLAASQPVSYTHLTLPTISDV